MLACRSVDEKPQRLSDASRPGLAEQLHAVGQQADTLRRSYTIAGGPHCGEIAEPQVSELIEALEAAKTSLGSVADLAMMLRRLTHAVRDSRDPHIQSVAAQAEVLLSARGLGGTPLR